MNSQTTNILIGVAIGYILAKHLGGTTGAQPCSTDPRQVISGYRYNQNCCGDRKPLFQPYTFSSDTKRMGMLSL